MGTTPTTASDGREVASCLLERGVVAEKHDHARGYVWLIRLGVRALGTVAGGHLDLEHADAILKFSDRMLTAGHLTVVHDWFGVKGYDAAGRAKITAWGAKHYKSLSVVHLGTNDRLLSLGATLVNTALQGRITIHRSQPDFERTVLAL